MAHRNLTHALALVITLALGALTSTTHAATLDVCASGCTYATVAGAVAAAGAGDTIELAAETFVEGSITLDKDLTIRATGGMATINATSFLAALIIDSGVFVHLENLRLEGGTYCRLDNAGTVDLSTVWIVGMGPGAPSTFGGVLNRASGTMTIGSGSAVMGNASVVYGGGINNMGHLVIIGATVTGNTGHKGGGFANQGGTASILSSSFSGNHANNRGGAWANKGYAGTLGSVAFHGSSSTSSNTAGVACDRFWDKGRTPSCFN
ncbi:MAG: hypothetical protein AAF772_02415 [Acidobacteriota bacterium]